MLTNMAKGRKGAWHQRNATRWDRKENKAREAIAREKAEFIHHFIYDETITIEDTTAMYCAGLVREFEGSYTFELQQSPSSEFLGVMGVGHLLSRSLEVVGGTLKHPILS